MTGDPLDRIEARAKEALETGTPDEWGYGYEHMGDMWRDFAPLCRDILALVQVARAARDYRNATYTESGDGHGATLDAALARLDKEQP